MSTGENKTAGTRPDAPGLDLTRRHRYLMAMFDLTFPNASITINLTLGDLPEVMTKLERLIQMNAELQAAIDNITSVVTNTDASVTALAIAVSEGTAANQTRIDSLTAMIADLQAQLAAGVDVAPAVAALADLAGRVSLDNSAIDAATTALQVALTPPAP